MHHHPRHAQTRIPYQPRQAQPGTCHKRLDNKDRDPPDEAEKLPADEFDRGLWLPAAVAGSVCVRVEGEVVETASDPLRSATGE